MLSQRTPVLRPSTLYTLPNETIWHVHEGMLLVQSRTQASPALQYDHIACVWASSQQPVFAAPVAATAAAAVRHCRRRSSCCCCSSPCGALHHFIYMYTPPHSSELSSVQ